MRVIDADALEKDGWMMHRIVQVDSNTMEYQTKKPTGFPTIEPEPCEDAISRKAAIETILGQPTEAHYPEWYASQIKELPPAQPDCTDCKKHGGDWECDHMHCRKGRLQSVQPEPRWIPVSERLPHGSYADLVNVSIHDDSGNTPFDYTSCGWVTTDGEYWIVDNEINNHVIAWMPLPEPYKERREE